MKKPSFSRIIFRNGASESFDGKKGRTPRASRLQLEALESRELLDAAPLVNALANDGAAEIRSIVSEPFEPISLSNAVGNWLVTTNQDVVDPDDGLVSLREAIDGAQDGDTILFDDSLAGTTIALNGTYFDVTKSLTIDASNLWNQENDAPGLAIDGGGTTRVFRSDLASADAIVVVKGLEFKNGRNGTRGGAIMTAGGNFVVEDSLFHNNYADNYGGAIALASGNLTVRNSKFNDNSANNYGGAVFVAENAYALFDGVSFDGNFSVNADGAGGAINTDGAIEVVDSSFTNNASGIGGAIQGFVASSITATGSTFENNNGKDGGAIYSHNSLTIDDSSFTGNASTRSGGALYCRVALAIDNSTFANNAATESSGAIAIVEAVAVLTNANFTGNSAQWWGGAIVSHLSTTTISESNFSANESVSDGAGIYTIDATLTLIDDSFESNVSQSVGGAVYGRTSTVTITDVEFLSNTAGFSGGGVGLDRCQTTMSKVRATGNVGNSWAGFSDVIGGEANVDNSYFVSNSAPSGGGAFSTAGCVLTISGSEFVGNSTDNSAGAIHVNGTATVVDSTFTNNSAYFGGAIDVIANGTAEVTGSTFTENSASYAGGAAHTHSGGTLTVRDSEVVRNSATSYGGGFDADGLISIDGVTLTGNTSGNASGGFHVGRSGSAVMVNSTFTENHAAYRGGATVLNGPAQLDNIVFTNNTADQYAGAIDITRAGITITDSVFTGNRAAANVAGAVRVEAGVDGTATIQNSIFSENQSAGSGGAISLYNGTLLLENSLLYKNQANLQGGAIDVSGGSNVGVLNAINTTIVDNVATDPSDNVRVGTGSTANFYNSIIVQTDGSNDVYNDGGTLNAYNTLASYVDWSNADSATNYQYVAALSLFADAANDDYTLANNSVAIHAGDAAYLSEGTTTDLAGAPRVALGAVDLGAYEYNGDSWKLAAPQFLSVAPGVDSITATWTPIVGASRYYVAYAPEGEDAFTSINARSNTTLTISGLDVDAVYKIKVRAVSGNENAANSTWSEVVSVRTNPETPSLVVTTLVDVVDAYDRETSLREAVEIYAQNGDTITFAPSLAGGTITLNGTQISVDKPMTIDASALWDAENDAPGITIDADQKSRLFDVRTDDGENAFTIDSIALVNGRVASSSETGAAIHADYSLVHVNAVVAENCAGLNGGAFNAHHSAFEITNSKFVNNNADSLGGAIAVGDDSRATIRNAQFTNNTAGNEGGAIYVRDGSALIVESSAFTGNTATNFGGGVFVGVDSNAKFTETTFDGNSALAHAGGAINTDGIIEVVDCLFTGNQASADNGGAIQCWTTSTATISGSTFQGNSAYSAGAIYAHNILTITDTIFTENTSAFRGGAVALFSGNSDVATIIDGCEFTNNTGGYGGGLFAMDRGAITTNTTFTSNTATQRGGGAWAENPGAVLTFNNVEFNDNTATYDGGAICADASASLIVADSDFNRNTANTGGAIWSGGGEGSLTITNGDFSRNVAQNGEGGALRVHYTPATITGGTFEGNTSTGHGGAARFDNAAFSISQASFTGNQSGNQGGAFKTDDCPTISIDDCEFVENAAAGMGGAIQIWNTTTTTLTNSEFTRNTSGEYGGGVFLLGSEIVSTDLAFTGNVAQSHGGGIYLSGSGRAEFTDSSFIGNRSESGNGGAIFSEGNVVGAALAFTGNTSASSGGAICISSGALRLENSLLIKNGAENSGGIYLSGTGVLNAINTTIADNVSTNSGFDVIVGSDATANFYNSIVVQTDGSNGIAGDGTINAFNTLSSFVDWTNADSATNFQYDATLPLFKDAANDDYTLAGSSQAIDLGDNSYTTSNTDLLGLMRVDNDRVDLGPYEYNGAFFLTLEGSLLLGETLTASVAPLTINVNYQWYRSSVDDPETWTAIPDATESQYATTEDDLGRYVKVVVTDADVESRVQEAVTEYFIRAEETPTLIVSTDQDVVGLLDGRTSLREAIAYAQPGDTITFAPGLAGKTIRLNGTWLDVTKSLTIDASNLWDLRNDVPGLVLDGGGTTRIVRSELGSDDETVVVKGLEFKNGVNGNRGGAIMSSGGNFVVEDSVFTDNYASGYGGAIALASGNLTVRNSVFTGNTGDNFGGAVHVMGTATISNSQFTNNTGVGNLGGGAICLDEIGTLTVESCDFTRNSGPHGGAISAWGELTIIDSVFTQNTASVDGGAIYSEGNITGDGLTLANNHADVYGGAVRCYNALTNATVTFANSTFDGNTANSEGGAIKTDGGAYSFENCDFTENSTPNVGGAAMFYQPTTLQISQSTFTRNQSTNSLGGALYVTGGTLNFDDLAFEENSAQNNGGAMFLTGGTVTIANSDFINNAGQNSGGVGLDNCQTTITNINAIGNVARVWAGFADVVGGAATFVDSYFANNASENGGGAISTYNCVLNVSGSEFVGNSTNASIDSSGGAIHANCTATVVDSTFTNNSSYYGGAIEVVANGTAEVTGSTFTGNSASYAGGAAHSGGTLTITNSEINRNYAKAFGGGLDADGLISIDGVSLVENTSDERSGGFHVGRSGSAVMTNSSFTDNHAGYRGGAVTINGTAQLNSVIFTNNSANEAAGAIDITYTGATIDSCVFVGNRTQTHSSGAINVDVNGNATIRNSIFTENQSARNGGAIGLYNGTLLLENSLLYKNRANLEGGAVNVSGGSYVGVLNAINTTIVDNVSTTSASADVKVGSGSTANFYNSIIVQTDGSNGIAGDGAINAFNSVASYVDWANADSATNYQYDATLPLFKDAANADYTLARFSQAINVGDNTYSTSEFDLAGEARVASDVVDAGAYEYQLPVEWFVVTLEGEFKLGATFVAQVEPSAARVEYEWYRASAEDAEAWQVVDGANASEYAVTTNDLGYYLKVVVVSANDSTKSVEAATNDYLSATLTTPENLVADEAKVTFNSVTLEWNAVEYAAGYRLQYKTSDDVAWTTVNNVPASAVSYTIGDLVRDESYDFRIMAYGDSEYLYDSEYSATITAVPRAQKLDSPIPTSEKIGPRSITISWNAEPLATKYFVKYKLESSENYVVVSIPKSTTSFTVDNIDLGATCEFMVQAIADRISRLNSDYSEPIFVTTAPQTLDAPVLSVSPSENSLTVTWTADPNAARYYVLYKLATDEQFTTVSVPGTDSSFVLENLPLDVTYEFKARAIGDKVDYFTSDYSELVSGTTQFVDLGPQPLETPTMTSTATSSSITVSWNENPNATKYYLKFKEASDKSFTTLSLPNTQTSFTIDDLDLGVSYEFKVQAIGNKVDNLNSEYSDLEIVTTELPTLETPTITTEAARDSITVSWNANPNAAKYYLRYKPSTDKSFKTISLSKNVDSYTLNDLELGATYHFKIQAIGDKVNYASSGVSEIFEATTTLPNLDAPILTVTSNEDSITASWNAVQNAVQYFLKYRKVGVSEFTTVSVIDENDFTLSGLAENDSYEFRIQAVADMIDYLNSDYSDPVFGTVVASDPTTEAILALGDELFEELDDELATLAENLLTIRK